MVLMIQQFQQPKAMMARPPGELQSEELTDADEALAEAVAAVLHAHGVLETGYFDLSLIRDDDVRGGDVEDQRVCIV